MAFPMTTPQVPVYGMVSLTLMAKKQYSKALYRVVDYKDGAHSAVCVCLVLGPSSAGTDGRGSSDDPAAHVIQPANSQTH